MKRERKIYDPAFKTKAVQLSNERTNVSELARELGIKVTLLYKWRKEYEEFGDGSFPGKGNCWDNAVAESFFKSLKTELIYGNKLITKQQMELEIFEYIEIWYNKKRRHSALNYKTIEEFNNQNSIYKNVA